MKIRDAKPEKLKVIEEKEGFIDPIVENSLPNPPIFIIAITGRISNIATISKPWKTSVQATAKKPPVIV